MKLRVVGTIVAGATALMLAGGPGDAKAADSTYAGSQACGKCHTTEYKSWQGTMHAKMVRPAKEAMLKDAADNWAKDSKGNAGPTKGNVDGKPYKIEDVQLVIGSKWKQRYLVKSPAGGHQFMDKQWNRMTKVWEGYGQNNDWETNCSTCHTTGFRLTAYDPKNPQGQKWAFAEMNIGCEACHGPGAKHIASGDKADIFNPKTVRKSEISKVCGYCHIRGENDQFLTVQGRPSEYLPHPEVGQSFQPGRDDWTKWYTDHVIIPGVNPKYPYDQAYGGDLKGMFRVDEQSQKSGLYDAGKHHQQYQEYIQSKHFKRNLMSCADCHSAHASSGKPMIKPAETCKECHGNQYDWQKIMPGTGQTATGLFVRTHTFNKNQARPQALTASPGEPEYKK